MGGAVADQGSIEERLGLIGESFGDLTWVVARADWFHLIVIE